MSIFTKSIKAVALGAIVLGGLSLSALAQELKFYTIGTGGTAYTY